MKLQRRSTLSLTMVALSLVLGGGYLVGQHQAANALTRTSRPGMQSALDLQQAFSSVAQDVEPAVVSVKVAKTIREMKWQEVPGSRLFGRFRQYQRVPGEAHDVPVGEGSGFIIRDNGYALTNFHVVKEADSLTVKLHDGQELPAKVVGTDELLDLAVIKIDSPVKLPTVELGNSDELNVGQWALAIGNPFHLGNTFTVGVVSAKGRELDSLAGQVSFQNYIQTDASINPGNSGGPLVNIYGEVVGINNAIYSPTGASVGIGFAIPINNAKRVLDDLLEGKRIVRGYLGVRITDLTPQLAVELNSPRQRTGVVIASVERGGPANRGGIAPGDILTEFDGVRVGNADELMRAIAQRGTGQVEVRVVRQGKSIPLKVNLGEFPSEM